MCTRPKCCWSTPTTGELHVMIKAWLDLSVKLTD